MLRSVFFDQEFHRVDKLQDLSTLKYNPNYTDAIKIVIMFNHGQLEISALSMIRYRVKGNLLKSGVKSILKKSNQGI